MYVSSFEKNGKKKKGKVQKKTRLTSTYANPLGEIILKPFVG